MAHEVHQVLRAGGVLRFGHSCKLAALQHLDLMFPTVDKVEQFARRQLPGWAALGDAIDGRDLTITIQELATL